MKLRTLKAHDDARSTGRAINMQVSTDTDQIRTETLDGVTYKVFPIVALQEGVFRASNAPVAEFVSAKQLNKYVKGWNGRPITLNHPVRNGMGVSAAETPTVFTEEALGTVFNAKFEDRKLKVEGWINETKVANSSDEIKAEIKRLENGEVFEVSVGVFTEIANISGRFNGAAYEAEWKHLVPDHLAILAEGVEGACSVASGCGGPRLNSNGDACSCKDDTKCGCESLFTLTSLVDAGPTPSPDNKPDPKTDPASGAQSAWSKWLNKVGSLITFRGLADISSGDTRTALYAALNKVSDYYCYIVAIFPTEVVYEAGVQMLRRSYSIGDDNVITLGSDMIEVRPVTEFVPLQIETEEPTIMTKAEMIIQLLASASNKLTEADKPTLEALSEDLLEKLGMDAAKPADAPAADPTPIPAADPAAAPVTDPTALKAPPGPITMEQYLANAPAEVKSVLTEGIQIRANKRTQLITSLTNNSTVYTKAELEVKDLNELEKLAQLAKVPDFSGGAGTTTTLSSADNVIPMPEALFPAAGKTA